MKTVLGFALAFTLALAVCAAAEQKQGTVQTVDQADQSIILDDGTRLSVSGSQLTQISIGEQVLATYEMKGAKKVVIELHRDLARERAAEVQSGD